MNNAVDGSTNAGKECSFTLVSYAMQNPYKKLLCSTAITDHNYGVDLEG